MSVYIIFTFLWSISPFGEARLGIPYGVYHGLPVQTAFLVGWIANLLVFPMFHKIIVYSNRIFWGNKVYRKAAIFLSKRAKRQTKNNIQKYGFLGLMIFVMIPLPITGSYIGTLASYIFGMDYKKSFLAISTGVTISCVLIATGIALGISIM